MLCMLYIKILHICSKQTKQIYLIFFTAALICFQFFFSSEMGFIKMNTFVIFFF